MIHYIAFLRGINAGVTVKMEVLRGIFEDMGFANVRTVLATGNVLFETKETDKAALESKIEKAIAKAIGYTSHTIVWTADELQQFVTTDPFKDIAVTPTAVPQVTFIKNPPATKNHYPLHGKGYTILGMVHGAVCSTVDLSGATTPDLMRVLEKEYGKTVTTRNWKTIQKIVNSYTTFT
jgi:uncharacterized protein (DUF1697 family)